MFFIIYRQIYLKYKIDLIYNKQNIILGKYAMMLF